LDLDDYNKEVHEGLHITSMAGTWMSIVEGFGGMRVKNSTLHFEPKIPTQWKGYSFKINFRNQVLEVSVRPNETKLSLEGDKEIIVFVNGKEILVEPNSLVTV
jgi:maltose phosphorylase